MNTPVIRLKYEQESMRKAAGLMADSLIEFANAAEVLANATFETYRKLAQEYCRIAGKMLALSIYERIIWTYPTNGGRGKKNTRLQRVARQGPHSTADRLSELQGM